MSASLVQEPGLDEDLPAPCEQIDPDEACVQAEDGTWIVVPSDDNIGPGFVGDDFGDGFAGLFGFFFVLVVVLGVAGTAWRVTTARRLAQQSGMDPDRAAEMALFTESGLEATYLASSLRQPPAAPAESAAPGQGSDAAARLRELQGLRDQGLITEDEYVERRRAIVDGV